MTRTSSIPEKPLCQSPRKLTDWLKPDGQRKVHSMIDTVYQPKNLRAAWDKVKANRGSGGIDGQSLEAVEQGLEEHLHRLHEDLRTDRYQPLPVRRVDIPKAGKPGEWRPLGIPAGIDRVCQQALLNRLEPIFESLFDDSSFGYRPGRSAKDALRKVWREIEAGAEWIVDADLKDYFGVIDHAKLMTLVGQRVADGRVLTLIEQMLTAGYMEGDRLFPTPQGTPQGGVVSPLLSNILLTPFDREMRQRGYQLTRYADDWVVTCRSRREAEVALGIAEKILGSLGVQLNRQKTQIVHVRQGFVFLGYKITLLILQPIFEADLEPTAYGYRPGRTALEAVQEVHRALCAGHTEVIDGDVTSYFDTIPHADLMKSLATRLGDQIGRASCRERVALWEAAAYQIDD